jgi:hypothetical protein
MNIKIRRQDGRVLGSFNTKSFLFTRSIRGSRHILRRPEPSICVDVEVLKELLDRHCLSLRVNDIEDGTNYHIAIDVFIANSFSVCYSGQGKQLGCPLIYWSASIDRKSKKAVRASVRQVITAPEKQSPQVTQGQLL